MSKYEAQRAMKEAKYERYLERAKGAAPTTRTSTTPAAVAPDVPKQAAPSGTDACGHKSMNGRACTREAGHSEKSHRYS